MQFATTVITANPMQSDFDVNAIPMPKRIILIIQELKTIISWGLTFCQELLITCHTWWQNREHKKTAPWDAASIFIEYYYFMCRIFCTAVWFEAFKTAK
jgi:hypothetical protein